MRIGKTLAAVAAAATIATTVAVPASAQDPGTIVDIVIAESGETGFDHRNRDYDILREALIATDLADVVASAEGITVFAPRDGAFIRLARDLGYHGWREDGAFAFIADATGFVDADNPGLLADVLTYHVAPGLITSGDLADGPITTLQGGEITPVGTTLVDLDPNARDPKVRTPFDIEASNGIIHTINRVLRPIDLPPEVPASAVDVVIATSGDSGFDHRWNDYDLLREALLATGLADTVAGLDDVTVFAPTDFAFLRLAWDLGFHGWSEADAFAFLAEATGFVSADEPGLLADVLTYHVGLGAGTVSELQGEVETLAGVVTVDGRKVVDGDPDDRDARIVRPRDVVTGQGFVQTVNRVLRPIDL